MRPLGAKLAELQRRHTDVGEELQRYLAMVRQKGEDRHRVS